MKKVIKKIICMILCFAMIFTTLQTTMFSASAKVVGPDNKTELTITTDKSKYSWGDTIVFNIDVKNVSNETLTGIRISSLARNYMKLLEDGDAPVISKLEPGETTTVQVKYFATKLVGAMAFFFPIIWLFSPAARILYRETPFNYEKKVKVGAIKYRIGFEVEYNIIETSEDFVDSDGDGLSDKDEDFYKTDKNKKDTDGDTLTDLEELLMGTDPLIANSIPYDTDSDGLSDIDEVRIYYTDPQAVDSDSDELSDFEEVRIYHTNPTNEDTDGDGLRDGFEIKHGLDPLKASTDGIHNDSKVKIKQEIDESGISVELRNENIAPPSIYGSVNGELAKNVFVATSTESTLQDNRAIVGMPVYIDGENNYIKGLTLSFDLSSFNGDVESLKIVKVNEGGNYELVDSTLTKTNIACELYAGGDYCLIDVGKFLNEMGINIYDIKTKKASVAKTITEKKGIKGQADVVFAIDTTGSMTGTIENVISNVTIFSSALAKDYNVNVNFALIDYKDITYDGANSTRIISNGYQNWYSDVNDFISSVETLSATGGGDTPECGVDALETARQLDFRRTASKFIILISDSNYKVANNYDIKSMDEEIELLKKDGIHVSVVTTSSYASTYKSLYESTGGIFANISSSSFSSSLLSLASLIGEETTDGTWVILKHGYRYVKLPEIPSVGSKVDTDGDGLSDYDELGKETTIDLSDFIKIQLALKGIPFSEFIGRTTITVYDAKSDPTLADTDGDGIDDKKDTAPWKKGLKGGIVGAIKLFSCGETNNTSGNLGHAFVSYTSFIDDDILLYGIYVESKEKVAGEYMDVPFENISDPPQFKWYNYRITSNNVITLGSWAGWLAEELRGTWINQEYQLYKNGTNSGHISISEYVTSSDVEKMSILTNSLCEWHWYYNCSSFARDLWNTVTGDNIYSGVISTPKNLINSMKKRNNYKIQDNLIAYWPEND